MPSAKELAKALAYQGEIRNTSRNRLLGGVADALSPVSEFADQYKISDRIPFLGGMSAADLTGLKGAQSLVNDMSYGKSPISGASLQTTKVDPRVLDLAGVSGAMMPAAKSLGKAALREGARQIETGTGIGRAALDPRARIVQKDLQDAFPDVDFSLSQRGKQATLNKVIVPKEQRGKGVGSEFMNALTKAADTEGTQLALSPSADFGGNKSRLVDFYKQFGFVPNKGRKIDFSVSESMRREPQAIPQRPKTEFEILHDTAQRNAALPVDQGGLGLPANNTYIDRANAPGMYPTDA